MSFYLLNVQNPENDYTTGKRIITGHFECDTVADLPTLVQSTYIARIGSTAHIIDTNALYAVKSNGVWCVQETGTDVYTKSQIDTMLSVKADKATTIAGYGITNAYTKIQTDTAIANAVSNKISMLNILGAGTRITATSDSPLSFDDAPFTSVGRFNWLSTSTPHITNCPSYIGGVAKGGLLETSLIQGGTTILQTAWASAGDDTPGIFWRRYRYGSPETWTNWYKFEGARV